jgi:hypothetical protein
MYWLQNCLGLVKQWYSAFFVPYPQMWPPLRSSGQSSWLQNGDVLCFLWGTNWIYICYVEESRPPLWSSGQSSWLQNGDVLCFLWGTNWIYICYIEGNRPPLWSSGQSFWLQNGDVLCFLWGTNRIYICYVEESRPPLWPTGQELLATDPKVWVRVPALPDFLRISGSGTAVGICHADHVAPSIRKRCH